MATIGIIKLTEKTSGRDKLCRVVQYGSKFVYWVLEQGAGSPELVSKLKALEGSISTARKCKASQLSSPYLDDHMYRAAFLSLVWSPRLHFQDGKVKHNLEHIAPAHTLCA